MSTVAPPSPEAREEFACFGGTCSVVIAGSGPSGMAPAAVRSVRRRLLEWHRQFSRFEASSELSRLNHDPREDVPVTATMTRFVAAALHAAEMTGGLVDPTLVPEIERAGYSHELGPGHTPPARAARLARAARPARPSPEARWRQVRVDRRAGLVSRPVGLKLDSGGIAKGLFGDILAPVLSLHEGFVIAAAGDARFGGAAGIPRLVEVSGPFDDREILHRFELTRGAVATSGTTKRSWLDDRGRLSHHLLDPATGRPAFTGVIQATALAPTGVDAEALAKAALLAGPDAAGRWLPHGGLVVYGGGTHRVIEPRD